jgi:5-formyltetrahydrofolate cyclo-ligase
MVSNRSVAAAKRRMRTRMRALRDSMPPGERAAASALVNAAVLALPDVEAASNVLAFASFGSEVATAGVLQGLADMGKRVLLPFLVEGEMEACIAEPGAAVVPTSYGPVEPASRHAADPAVVDAILAPGLAFDRAGRRLGYGRGYFDRYLRRVPVGAPRIAIGFALQVVDEVPATTADERLDLVVTEAGVIECSPPRRG